MIKVREQKFVKTKLFFLISNTLMIIAIFIIMMIQKNHYRESINSMLLLVFVNCYLSYCLFHLNRENESNEDEEILEPKSLKEKNSIEDVYDFLKKCGTFYLATVDNNVPRGRPFGALNLYEGRLYIHTGKVKKVSKQMQLNPNVEISGFYEGTWIRIEGKVVRDDRIIIF